MFASRYVYLLSLSLLCFLCWFLFFWNSLSFFFLKKLPFSFVRPFFVKLFLFRLLRCFAPFPVCFCFFNRVLSSKINWLLSLGRKTTCLIPPRTYFLNFCFFFSKGLSSFFFDFFEVPFFKKLFFWISENIPHKNGFNNKMVVQISLSGNPFVFRKKIRLSSVCRKMFFIISFLCLSSFKKSFLEKISFEKIVFLKKNKTSFISSWFLLHLYFQQKLFSIFQLSFYFFAFVVLSLFSSFSDRFFLVSVFPNKKVLKRSFEKHIGFSQHFLLNFFWRREHILIQKVFKNYRSDFLQKKNSFKEQTYFKIHTRWGSRARMKALLTIAACRAAVEWVMSVCIQLPFISAEGHPLHQAISLLFFCFSFFFGKPRCKKMFW